MGLQIHKTIIMLVCMVELWSSCGDERVIASTKTENALHTKIHMSYRMHNPFGLNILGSNYLGNQSQFTEIGPMVAEVMKSED